MEKNTQDVNVDAVFLHLSPKELQRLVFNHLDHKSLLAARCVSKLWKDLVDSTLTFHLELSNSTSGFVQAFGESRQVASLTTTAFRGRYPPKGLQLEVQMLRITVANLDGSENHKEYRRRSTQDPVRNIGLCYYSFRGMIQEFYWVERFQIASLAVMSFTETQREILGRVYLPNVKEMIISFFDGGFYNLFPFLRNYFPKLESINIANFAEFRMDRPLIYSWIFSFVGRHHKTIKDVTVVLPEGMITDRGSGGGNHILPALVSFRDDLRRDITIPQHTYRAVKHRLETVTKLKKLNWDIGVLEGQRRYNLGTALLVSQTMLVELHIDNLDLNDLPLLGRLNKLLDKVCGTLELLYLGGCFCDPPSVPLRFQVFDCSSLKNCMRLKRLEMVICGTIVESVNQLPFESLIFLNLGHMLLPSQIEFICRHGINLEMWMVPQSGHLKNVLVAKVTCYLFQCMLYLPKLRLITLCSVTAEATQIVKFVGEQPGIQKCGKICVKDQERNGDMVFHIDREIFARDFAQLHRFMEENRINPVESINLVDFFANLVRNV